MSTIKAENIAKGANSTDMDNAIFGSAKAWISFNSVGTHSIRASYNISSTTDRGNGQHTLNYTNALPQADCALAGCSGGAVGSYLITYDTVAPTKTTTSTEFESVNYSGSDTNNTYTEVVVFA